MRRASAPSVCRVASSLTSSLRVARGSGLTRLTAVATALALFLGAAHPLEAATKKKKKKHPAPTSAGELDTPAPAPGTPAPASASPPAAAEPPPPPAPAADAPAPAEKASSSHAAASSAHDDSYAPLGSKHTLVFDDLSGFRAGTADGVGYSGPLGFRAQTVSQNILAANGSVAGTDSIHSTTIWFAPSADYFLFEHISLGVLIEVAYTSSNFDQSVFQTATKNQSLPATTNVTILPRGGYMLALSEHWGLWPRLGLGWALVQQNPLTNAGAGTTTTPTSNSTFLLDVDVGVLYRMDARWFLRAGPEVTFGPGSGLLSFSVAGGFGYMWSI
jgi:hypothetical protein